MKSNTIKSIAALLAGFVAVVVISIATDLSLGLSGIMKRPFDLNPTWFIGLIVVYRSLYSALGAYITAHFAPSRPFRLAMIGGGIGLILSIVGAVSMWDVPPRWYPIALIVTALPSAWVGAMIWLRSHPTLKN